MHNSIQFCIFEHRQPDFLKGFFTSRKYSEVSVSVPDPDLHQASFGDPNLENEIVNKKKISDTFSANPSQILWQNLIN